MADTSKRSRSASGSRRELDEDEAREREVKEVATKLRSLSAAEKAEVFNRIATRQVSRQVNGFAEFIREQGVVGVGVGLVLGIQMKAVVDTVMASLVNPITELVLPGKQRLSEQTSDFVFHGDKVNIGWGAVVYSLFTFLIVAFIVYVAYKLLRLDRLAKKKDNEAEKPKTKAKK